ncbi:MAG: hypothetical protein CTY16_13070 [Methylobacter sp.]|nr:MAG: hypothetical protein CTY16_13070 [Methylobacter sp.]
MDILLELHHLSLSLGQRRVLDGISLNIVSGEIHALMGTNGAGKSTLAYAIMGCEDYRSETVGIPKGLSPPSFFGISTL